MARNAGIRICCAVDRNLDKVLEERKGKEQREKQKGELEGLRN